MSPKSKIEKKHKKFNTPDNMLYVPMKKFTVFAYMLLNTCSQEIFNVVFICLIKYLTVLDKNVDVCRIFVRHRHR